MAITGKSVHGCRFRVAVEVPNQGRYPRAHTPFPAKPPVWRARIQQPQQGTLADPPVRVRTICTFGGHDFA
jgi:hypothetical protein